MKTNLLCKKNVKNVKRM